MIKTIMNSAELPTGFLKYALAEVDSEFVLRVASPLDNIGLDWSVNHPDLFLTSDKFVSAGFLRSRGNSLVVNGSSGNFPTSRKHAETGRFQASDKVGLLTATLFFKSMFDDRKVFVIEDGSMISADLYINL